MNALQNQTETEILIADENLSLMSPCEAIRIQKWDCDKLSQERTELDTVVSFGPSNETELFWKDSGRTDCKHL